MISHTKMVMKRIMTKNLTRDFNIKTNRKTNMYTALSLIIFSFACNALGNNTSAATTPESQSTLTNKVTNEIIQINITNDVKKLRKLIDIGTNGGGIYLFSPKDNEFNSESLTKAIAEHTKKIQMLLRHSKYSERFE